MTMGSLNDEWDEAIVLGCNVYGCMGLFQEICKNMLIFIGIHDHLVVRSNVNM